MKFSAYEESLKSINFKVMVQMNRNECGSRDGQGHYVNLTDTKKHEFFSTKK